LDVDTGGVVRDPAVWHRAIDRVIHACAATGLGAVAVMPSPVRGPAGNVEFPLHLVRGRTDGAPDVGSALEEAGRLVGAA
jgi:23S rRNA (cytidine1920-2'-O)/16S rRNA (cytidine1409-2'-O)-methyltransferase